MNAHDQMADGARAETRKAERAPDFVIGGAPKCGTTSLHFILGQHPDIGIPDDEVSYFDADDPIIHPDYFFFENDGMRWKDARPDHDANRAWYFDRFASFADRALIGEDSTLYLFSEAAPHRLKEAAPAAKVIFMLRDPVKRAVSQYWHEMSMMRVTCSFERALVRHPPIIRGSIYRSHLERWLSILGPERVKIILFEDFIARQQEILDEVADFIGAKRFDASSYDLWFNKTYYPISVTGQKILNRAGQYVALQRYRSHINGQNTRKERIANKIYQTWFHKVNPILLKATNRPATQPETLAFLTQHLNACNQGLSSLLDRDLSDVWPGFDG